MFRVPSSEPCIQIFYHSVHTPLILYIRPFKSGVFLFVEMKKAPMLDLESDQSEYDLRTITSALKQYFRYVYTWQDFTM